MCRRWLALVFLPAGLTVRSDDAWAEKRLDATIDSLAAVERVDMGVVLHVVVRDPAGKEMIPGVPRLREIDTVRRGGMVEIRPAQPGQSCASIVGSSENPVHWFCSPAQRDLIVHPDGSPLWNLVQGSEGAGKTYTLAQWLYFRVTEHIGFDREIGVTAPIARRLGHVRKAIRKLWSPSWYRWKEREFAYTFHAGPVVQLISAHQRSEDEGSPIQGANWVAHAGDELQDHFDKEGDIEARGRSAPHGRYKRLNTSTFKDSTDWRNFRAKCDASPAWHVQKLLGLDSPFVDPEHWERLRIAGTMTEREYQRRVLAMDVGPEKQLYFSWERGSIAAPGNLRPRPLVGAIDITGRELAPWVPSGNAGMLIGHDPGRRKDVSVFLKAYRVPGALDPWWFVVDEVTTEGRTYEEHVLAVLARLRGAWGLNKLDRHGKPDGGQVALVRCDPYTDNEAGNDENQPDITDYKTWQNHFVDIRPAAYRPGTTRRARVPREARINLVNTLLRDSAGVRRLYVDCDDARQPRAPRLVQSFEGMERDVAGRAEHERKDDNDLSHWPAALGYALWQVEKTRLGGRLGAAL